MTQRAPPPPPPPVRKLGGAGYNSKMQNWRWCIIFRKSSAAHHSQCPQMGCRTGRSRSQSAHLGQLAHTQFPPAMQGTGAAAQGTCGATQGMCGAVQGTGAAAQGTHGAACGCVVLRRGCLVPLVLIAPLQRQVSLPPPLPLHFAVPSCCCLHRNDAQRSACWVPCWALCSIFPMVHHHKAIGMRPPSAVSQV